MKINTYAICIAFLFGAFNVALAAPDTLRYPQPGEVFFTKNDGQWNENILFATMQLHYQLSFTKDGMYIKGKRPLDNNNMPTPGMELIETSVYRDEELHFLRFLNRSDDMQVFTEDRLGNKTQFYLTDKAEEGITDVPSYGKLVYENVWDGIDVIYTNSNGEIRQKVVLHENADSRNIRFGFTDMHTGNTADIKLFMQEAQSQLVSKKSDGYTVTQQSISGNFYLFDFEFGTIYGGSNTDRALEIAIDDAGNMYCAGATGSPDLPLKNAFDSTIRYVDTHPRPISSFILGISASDNLLLFSTYFNHRTFYSSSLLVAPDQTVWLVSILDYNDRKDSTSMYFPFTSDAVYNNPVFSDPLALLQIDHDGRVLYGSLFRQDSAHYQFSAANFDDDGNLYIAFHLICAKQDGTPYSFMTEGTLFPTRTVRFAYNLCLVKYEVKNDKVIHGTYLQQPMDLPYSPLNPTSLKVDSKRNIVLLGQSNGDFPQPVNPFANNPDAYSYLMKIDSSFSRVHWFSPAPGGLYSYISSIALDDQDRIHGVGLGSNYRYPFQAVEPMPDQFRNQFNSFKEDYQPPMYLRVSPDGRLLKCTTFMGDSGITYNKMGHPGTGQSVTLDECGNIYIYGEQISKIIPVFPRLDSADSHYLVVLDSGLTNIQYSTNLGYNDRFVYGGGFHDSPNRVKIGSDGTLYISSLVLRKFPTQNGFESEHQGGIDTFIGKLHIPMCNRQETCSIILPDTLRLLRRNGVVVDRSFDIHLELYNNGARPLTSPLAELSVAPGILLVNPTSNVVLLQPDFVPMLATSSAMWNASIDFGINKDTALDIRAISTYGIVSDSGSLTLCSKTLHVKFIDIPEYILTCSIGAPDTVSIGENNNYDPNPMSVSITLHNNGSEPNEIKKLVLRYISDKSIALTPPGDSLRHPGTLLPNDDYTSTFMFALERRSRERVLIVEFVAYDQFGMEMTRCIKEIIIPPLEGLDCSTLCTDTVRYGNDTGISIPNPITASVEIYNLIDTTQKGIQSRIDLSNAPHLKLAQGNAATKTVYDIAPGKSHVFTWELDIAPPVLSNVTEEVMFITNAWTTDEIHTCVCLVSIIALTGDALCTISAPDELTADDVIYTPNPFDLDYTLLNTGNAQLDVVEVVIQMPSYLTTTDPLAQSVGPLAPSAQHDVTWSLTALTSAYEREAVITVVAKDTEGNILSSCEHRVFIPGVDGLACDAGEDVTLVFNIDESKYEPDVFTKQVTVYNRLDTALTNVEIEASVSSNEIAITSPNPAMNAVGLIPANDLWITIWDFNVIGSDVATTVTVTYRTRSDQYPEWRECSFEVIVPPREFTYCADCLAAGIDTVWIDRSNEIMYPVPFQVYTAVTNNCTGILTDIQCTLSMPSRLSLAPGEPASQMIDLLKPGETMYVMWMLTAAIGSQDDALPVQIMINNGALAPIICEHTVYIQHSNSIQLAAAKKLLYFRAVQNDALPAAQEIVVYAGFPIEMPWTAQYPSWLNLTPNASPTLEIVTAQPNTTALPMQRHYGTIAYTSAHPNAPKNVEVIYDIVPTVGVPGLAVTPSGIVLHQNYPNPFASSTTISYTTSISQAVSITVYNTLGVAVREIQQDAISGTNTVQLSGLKAGLYMVVVRGKNGIASRIMLGR